MDHEALFREENRERMRACVCDMCVTCVCVREREETYASSEDRDNLERGRMSRLCEEKRERK